MARSRLFPDHQRLCHAQRPPANAWTPGNGLTAVDTQGRGLLLVRRDHPLGRYDDLLIERVGFRDREGQKWLSFPEEGRINSTPTSVVQSTQDGTIGIVNGAGPCVLSVDFYLTDLELHDPSFIGGSMTSFVSSFGEATLIMELCDSMSETPLAHFLQRRRLGGGAANGGAGERLRRLGLVASLASTTRANNSRRSHPRPQTAGMPNATEGWRAWRAVPGNSPAPRNCRRREAPSRQEHLEIRRPDPDGADSSCPPPPPRKSQQTNPPPPERARPCGRLRAGCSDRDPL
ncbi:MAG: hypothetical protein GY910_27440 [bacterium]|nr:hypothetical protein [bacterium]